MRINPQPKEELAKKSSPEYIQAITKKAALALAFVCVFFFFIKLLFL